MAQIKYYYDTETCNYERIKTSRWNVFFNLVSFLSSSLLTAICIFWSYTAYFDSPREARLKQENDLLKAQYALIQKEIENSSQVLAYLRNQDDNLYRVILEMEPMPHPTEKVVVSNPDRYRDLRDKNELIATTLQKVDQLKRRLYSQSKSYDALYKLAQEKETMLASIPAILPLANKDLKRLSSPFGMRIHPIYKIPAMHTGVDLAAPRGTPIYAAGNGVVKLVKRSPTGSGNHVVVEHGYGFLTKYCHMQDFTVKPGQRVARGQCIGYVGSTGTSTSPHLHYEVIKNRKAVNPAHYFVNDLDAMQYDMLLELASRKIRDSS
ncbi:MAG: M23 family metallopeptidase [Amoebophilaceae bacterium]|jgi:murein DD-endopeptidase MepM/ murein hydrolase activator NlpD|nr:M23 family metallopeptidase [Amoebophilaceae bacterium]